MTKLPVASYRLQFTPEFGFNAAREILPYLAQLGVSHLYASPILKPRTGSMHGYDVVDPNRLNPELGSEEEFHALLDEAAEHGIGWIQDIVPNHMAYSYENVYLRDMFENGERSPYRKFFDIEWEHPVENIRGRVLAPFLGDLYGNVLENGELSLSYSPEGFAVNYYEMRLPLSIESYAEILTYELGELEEQLGREHPDFVKLLGVLYVVKGLKSDRDTSVRYDQVGFVKRMLAELYESNSAVRAFIDKNLRVFNGEPGNPESYNRLDELLWGQVYRLAFWKVSSEEINYRRFFSINELISLRADREEVFEETHAYIRSLVEADRIQGLRIDHIDGLYDPRQYLERLRAAVGNVLILVEKITEPDEDLPESWPVEGTTGYEFLNCVGGVLCRVENRRKFARLYGTFTGMKTPYDELVYEKKRLIITNHMAGDLENLARFMRKVFGHDRHGIDITLQGLKRALMEVMIYFSVYRTYITDRIDRQADQFYISSAITVAKQKFPALLYELDYIERFLLLSYDKHVSQEGIGTWHDFVMRFQQFTGPLTAKGFEDTLLYVYNRLVSLNDVGSSPDSFGVTSAQFHQFNRKRSHSHPRAMNNTATHDTKRGEDMRVRLHVLSEMPGEWEKQLRSWRKLTAKLKPTVGGVGVPDRNDEYFLYQTLLGTAEPETLESPEYLQRIKDYTIKAVREAKVHTAWLKPDQGYEDGYLQFIEELLILARGAPFREAFIPFLRKLRFYGAYNSLSQVVLKLFAPGFPDLYQGTEFFELSLVDPDNRRPVDYARRAAVLSEFDAALPSELAAVAERDRVQPSERAKLFALREGLRLRRDWISLLDAAEYIPLATEGKYSDSLLAYMRRSGESCLVVAVPRFLTLVVPEGVAPLGAEAWHDTRMVLPEGVPSVFYEHYTASEVHAENGSVAAGRLFERFPFAILSSGPASS